MKPTVKKKERSKLELAVEKAEVIREKIVALEAEHEDIFSEWNELKDQQKAVEEEIKLEARKAVREGSTSTLIDDGSVYVAVQWRKPSVSYDFTTASVAWSAEVFDRCRAEEIDPEKVSKLIEANVLPEKVAAKCRKVNPATPAVTIRYAQ